MGGEQGHGSVDVRAVAVALAVAPGPWAENVADGLTAVGFDVVGADSITHVAEVVGDERPIVAIVDDRDPDWLRRVSDLVRLRPAVRVMAVVEIENPEALLSALSVGVSGFAPPTAELDALVRSVRSLVDDGVSIPRGMVSALVAEVRHGRGHTVRTAAGPVDVTDREWEILQLLVQRRSTREMADALYVSVGTVRSHISALLKKLGAVDREDAIQLLRRGRH